MKRNLVRTLFAAILASALVQACDPMEPSTYEEVFARFASVQLKDGAASLNIDYTGEVFNLRNFRTESDMKRFNVKNGDRVMAIMRLYATGTIDNQKITVDSLYKIPVGEVAQSQPADTMNLYYLLNPYWKFTLATKQYPTIWSQGHYVNITPFLYIRNDDAKADFYLYPTGVDQDTLEFMLYSDISDCYNPTSSATPYQSIYCFDISTMRQSVADPVENHRRDSLLNRFYGKDSIVVQVFMPDSVRVPTHFKNTETGYDTIINVFYSPKVSANITIPFDF
jgi:hypothetical protein